MNSADAVARNSRFSRAKKLSGLLLQERDRKILNSCYLYRHLTRSQLQRLIHMPCVCRINWRLRKLYDHRLLDRRFLPMSIQSSEALYFLGSNGVQLVAEALQLESDKVGTNRRKYEALKPYTLLHDTLVNDFRIGAALQATTLPTCAMLSWLDPYECEHQFESTVDAKRVFTSIRPDGFFQMAFKGTRYSFCLELDRSTCGHKKLRAKFQAYDDFLRAGLQEQAFGARSLHILVVTKSVLRRNELEKIAMTLNARSFFFATFADVATEPWTAIAWHRPGEPSARALFAGDQK